MQQTNEIVTEVLTFNEDQLAKIAFQCGNFEVFHNEGEQEGFFAEPDKWILDSTVVNDFAAFHHFVSEQDENGVISYTLPTEYVGDFQLYFRKEMENINLSVNELLVNMLLFHTDIEVNLYFKTDRFEAFEFHTKESVELDGIESRYFRFEHHFEKGEKSIHVASEEEYWIHEEATGLFQLELIEQECRKQFEAGTVQDHTEEYLAFLEEEGE